MPRPCLTPRRRAKIASLARYRSYSSIAWEYNIAKSTVGYCVMLARLQALIVTDRTATETDIPRCPPVTPRREGPDEGVLGRVAPATPTDYPRLGPAVTRDRVSSALAVLKGGAVPTVDSKNVRRLLSDLRTGEARAGEARGPPETYPPAGAPVGDGDAGLHHVPPGLERAYGDPGDGRPSFQDG
ncbi:hypothetical protein A1Q2_04653 [Trichosporon asahii var. asahii CBS 8904]|uniref:Uncharacterized protein n=1 Tax=Trichosporon asahii var. asahii (strain CBS 8904) TaxID=1220162 RepID=K1VNJ2_TRIAC|nr:hypothetical protein A1Q2_04653 [Trichosporon asahii var. asahii CBS 8904]